MFSLMPWKRSEQLPARTGQYDPFSLFNRDFQTMIDRFFGDWPIAFNREWDGWRGWGVDIHDTNEKVTVRAELPGFELNDINVHLADNVLTIEAKHGDPEAAEEGAKSNGKEYRHVRRSFTLPTGLDAEKVEATYRNGVLEITFPRVPEAMGRRIEVKA